VPRTTEATNVQQQLNHKPTYEQAALANQTTKQAERQRQASAEVDASAFLNVKGDGKGETSSRRGGGRKKRGEEDARLTSPESGHPFKGKHIDISL